jgi:hypothetical protein
METSMPSPIRAVVAELVSRGIELWLIGSRANSKWHDHSDWDLLAFGDQSLLAEFRRRDAIEGLDLLIVHNGDDFEAPWIRESDGATKSGSLSEWKWRRTTDDQATYKATRARPGNDFAVQITTEVARRVRTEAS